MAERELGVEAKVLESQQQADYERNLNAFIEEGCDIIITGWLPARLTLPPRMQNKIRIKSSPL
jgi:hypothetical protein